MSARIESTGWSGDGDFTRRLVDALAGMDDIAEVRVEDSPASRNDAGYAFLANEVYVKAATRTVRRREPWLLVLSRERADEQPSVTLEGLAGRLAALEDVGEPDYQDEGMLQFLRTERIVASWQTKGIKLVELVRVYVAGAPPRR
jgi:hypothetical protein